MQKIITFFGLQILFYSTLLLPAFASTPVVTPNFTADESQVMEDLVQEGDLMVLMRQNLPIEQWRHDEATTTSSGQVVNYPYIFNATCEDEDNQMLITDMCYTSIKSGVVVMNVYKGKTSSGQLVGNRTVARIGQGITGIYFPPGHNLDKNNLYSCIAGSATLFSPYEEKCLIPHPNPIIDHDNDGKITLKDRQHTNGGVMLQMASNLADEWSLKGMGVVVNGKISPFAAILFFEGSPFTVRAGAPAFAMGISGLADAAVNTTEKTALQIAISETAIAAQNEGGGAISWGWIDTISNRYDRSVSTELVGSLIYFGIALLFMVVSFAYLRNGFVSMIFFAAPIFFGMLSGFIYVELVFGAIALMLLPAVFTFVRRWMT